MAKRQASRNRIAGVHPAPVVGNVEDTLQGPMKVVRVQTRKPTHADFAQWGEHLKAGDMIEVTTLESE